MAAESYRIKTPVFEGPFGVLLDLIEKRKLFISDLSLAQVTEDYLKFVSELNSANNTEVSNFIVVTATLILIKSKSLLPDLNLTLEEEGDINTLEERLRLYEIFTKLSTNVKNNFGKRIIFAPQERKSEVLVFLPDDQITRESMMTFAHEVLGRIPKKTFLPEIEVKKVISIEEMIDKLTERIQNSLKTNFNDLSGVGSKPRTREEKVIVIVSFLAMLEMVRQGLMNAVQEGNGENIFIEKQEAEKEIEQ